MSQCVTLAGAQGLMECFMFCLPSSLSHERVGDKVICAQCLPRESVRLGYSLREMQGASRTSWNNYNMLKLPWESPGLHL